MQIEWSKIKNPFLNRETAASVRDPAVIFDNGIFRCFYTAVECCNGNYTAFLDMTESTDLVVWSEPRRLTFSDLGFSSPGNIIRFNNQWILCLQSYPINTGELYGNEDARLWYMASDDLVTWSAPFILKAEGSRVNWSSSHRQIDPFFVVNENRAWCFYKTSGCLGLMVSMDLKNWEEVNTSRPILAATDTPDKATVENPCIFQEDNMFIIYFSPCRSQRGIGIAKSRNMIDWYDIKYLDFPKLAWAPGGATAPFVVDMRRELGRWIMFFHGDIYGAALGIAWSNDLEKWECDG